MQLLKMQAILSDPTKRGALKKRLLEYPGVSDEAAEQEIEAHEKRVELKRKMLAEGLGNARAETALDRQGFPRPPGWHSVFFYPDSNRPRNRYAILFVLAAASALWFMPKF